jgi:branched-chain amino acid transport system permease protein
MAAVDIIITGVLLGGLFALVSVGFSLQYGVGRVLNVSYGEFLMVGAFVTYWLFSSYQVNPMLSLVVTAPLTFVIGWALYATLFRRLMDKAPTLDIFEGQSMLLAFGLLYVVQNIARIIWGSQTYNLSFLQTTVGGRLQIPLNRLVAFGVILVIGAALFLFLSRTRLGKAIRASGQDPTTAGLMGVDTHSVLAICFGIGLALAGIAGTLMSTVLAISTSMGLQYTVIAMIVVVLGGLGSITGAVIGGLILGIVSQLVTYFYPTMAFIAYYIIFILLLLVRPKGIMGK